MHNCAIRSMFTCKCMHDMNTWMHACVCTHTYCSVLYIWFYFLFCLILKEKEDCNSCHISTRFILALIKKLFIYFAAADLTASDYCLICVLRCITLFWCGGTQSIFGLLFKKIITYILNAIQIFLSIYTFLWIC